MCFSLHSNIHSERFQNHVDQNSRLWVTRDKVSRGWWVKARQNLITQSVRSCHVNLSKFNLVYTTAGLDIMIDKLGSLLHGHGWLHSGRERASMGCRATALWYLVNFKGCTKGPMPAALDSSCICMYVCMYVAMCALLKGTKLWESGGVFQIL